MAKRKQAKILTPRQARTLDQVCAMPRDNVGTDEHWLLVDGHTVAICQQRDGESPTAKIVMPRETFDAFADWYTTGRWRKPRRAGRRQ